MVKSDYPNWKHFVGTPCGHKGFSTSTHKIRNRMKVLKFIDFCKKAVKDFFDFPLENPPKKSLPDWFTFVDRYWGVCRKDNF